MYSQTFWKVIKTFYVDSWSAIHKNNLPTPNIASPSRVLEGGGLIHQSDITTGNFNIWPDQIRSCLYSVDGQTGVFCADVVQLFCLTSTHLTPALMRINAVSFNIGQY